MSPFLERLPWRIAALAGLVVGAVSWAHGTDPWVCLLRVGIAFAVFAALGLVLRASLLRPPGPSGVPKPGGKAAEEMPVGDEGAGDSALSSGLGDETKP